MSKLVVFSGAGLSAESGLETFRDSNGLWAKYDPMEVCNFQNWLDNFDLVHEFYNLRRSELGRVEPNKMHKYLASFSNEFKDKVEVIHLTQNVDDLLERAGASNVIHLHGELTKIICPKCGVIQALGYSRFNLQPCNNCGYDKMKPKIVFFYENAPEYKRLYEIFNSLNSSDCILVIGTSGNVIDISSIIYVNSQKIGFKILNNKEYSDMIAENVFDKIFYKNATEAINDIDSELREFFKL